MSKEFCIELKDENHKIGVYLVPHNIQIESNSRFVIKLGYICLLDKPHTFHSLDSNRIDLEVMTSIALQWDEYNRNVLEKEII